MSRRIDCIRCAIPMHLKSSSMSYLFCNYSAEIYKQQLVHLMYANFVRFS